MSIVLRGKVNKHRELTGPLPDSTLLAKNEWDFKLLSLILTPLNNDISGIFEVGCSLNTSSCFNYYLDQFQDKATPILITNLNVSRNETKTISVSDSVPWLRVDSSSDKVSIILVKAGTDLAFPDKSIAMVAHIAIKRIK